MSESFNMSLKVFTNEIHEGYQVNQVYQNHRDLDLYRVHKLHEVHDIQLTKGEYFLVNENFNLFLQVKAKINQKNS